MLGIFYYPWYGGPNNPESKWRHWKDDGNSPPATWNSRYLPSISGVNTSDPSIRLYDSFDATIVKRQMCLINCAHINFVIWSWWGQNSFSDHALSKFWSSLSNPPGLKHCIYYEKEWLDNVPQTEIISDINYLKSKMSGKYLLIDGKPVVFVYNSTPTKYRNVPNYQQLLSAKWNSIRQSTGIYVVLKVSDGWSTFKNNADSWHQYAPSTPYAKHPPYSSYVSPGWWSPKEANPRLARDLTRFAANVKAMHDDGMPLHTIQTWNEWTEGTGIEPASIKGINHGTKYVDILKSVF